MAPADKESEKIYHSIGEVARMFNVNTSLIRYWEKEFDILQPHKNKKGNRLFTKQDIDNLHLIYNLLKERGYTLEGAKQMLKHNPESTRDNFEIIKSLKKIRTFLEDLKKDL